MLVLVSLRRFKLIATDSRILEAGIMNGTLLRVGVPPAVLSQHLTSLVSALAAKQPVCSCSWAQFEMAALELASAAIS